MRVLYLGAFELPDKNAAAHRVISIAKTIRQAGHEVEFIGVTKNINDIDKTFYVDGFKYTSVIYPTTFWQWVNQTLSFIPISIITRKNPDVVILYNFYAIAQMRIIKYCNSHNIRVIGDITEWYQERGYSLRALVRRLDIALRMYSYNMRLDGIIAISRYLQNFYERKVNTVYIPPTVDLKSTIFKRYRNLNLQDHLTLIYAGSPGGKQKDRLDKIVKVLNNFNDIYLKIIGITEKQFLSTYMWTLPIPQNIKFLGRLSHSQTLNEVINSDFQIIIREENKVTRAGFPTKFVESLSCGIPVIATLSSNIGDYLLDGYNGFIVNESQTLEKCLTHIKNMKPEEIVKMKKHAIDTHDFDFRNYILTLDKLI